MKKYRLYTADDREPEARNTARMSEFTDFLSQLAKSRKAHNVTIWRSTDGHEKGFCVWYN